VSVDVEIDVTFGPVQGIPVPATAVDVTLLQGPAVLRGWSLRDAAIGQAVTVEGAVLSPGAGATIIATAALPPGEYTVNWVVELQGAAAAADADNFQLFRNGVAIVPSENLGAAGITVQEQVAVVLPSAQTISVLSIGAGTVGVTYRAEIAVEPGIVPYSVAELQDGNQPLGEISLQNGATDTEVMPGNGVQVNQQIKLHVISGAVTGVVYVQNIH
jgi:hypothetical protein